MNNQKSNNFVQRIFIPGDKWLYIKVYCGIIISDYVLMHTIKPLTADLLKKGLIDKWFFIRYADPEEHLRIRIHIKSIKELNKIIQKLKNELLIYFKNNQIWNVEFSTYKREMERYGSNNMENSEYFFFLDSEYIIDNIIKFKKDTDRFLNIINYVEEIIEYFELKDRIKIEFLKKMQLRYKKEFNANNTTIKELNKKYKELSREIKIEQLNCGIELKKIITKMLFLNNTIGLNVSLENLVASYIHMTINRSFSSNQRLYELMVYDFLYKTNNSKLARYGKL